MMTILSSPVFSTLVALIIYEILIAVAKAVRGRYPGVADLIDRLAVVEAELARVTSAQDKPYPTTSQRPDLPTTEA